MQTTTTKILTLETIKEWLEQKPPEEVVYFDSFSGQHYGLLDAYYTPTQVSGEFDKVTTYDPTYQKKSRRLATYDQDLTRFHYWLHVSPYRYCPTASQLLSALEDRSLWDYPPMELFIQDVTSIERFNAVHESILRPENVSWKHKEIVTFEGHEYVVTSELNSDKKLDGGHDTYILAEKGTFFSAEYYLTHSTPQLGWPPFPVTWPSHDADYGGTVYRFGAFGRMFDQTTKTILCNGKVFGVWQRQGHRLLRIQ